MSASSPGQASLENALAHPPLPVFPERLAQLALEHLARARKRQRAVPEIDAARTLVSGDQGLAELDQLIGRDLGAALEHDHGMDCSPQRSSGMPTTAHCATAGC